MNADRARVAYLRQFGEEPTVLVRAPGRVNLIGEHTDYNDGFVLPCAIDRDTVIAAGPASDGRLRVVAADFDAQLDTSALSAEYIQSDLSWADYVRATAAVFMEDGLILSGARLAIAGDVPLGSGLSSSASLEVAVGAALAALAGAHIDLTRMALLAQRAENTHVGCQCGIMDQLIAARGVARHALLIDCRSLDCRPVRLPPDIAIVIAHSGVRHAHAGGEYNDRRRQCEIAAAHYGVSALRDLDVATLEHDKDGLDEIAYARARHVVTENDRTEKAAVALEAGDLPTIGRLMMASHASMRDDFEITVPAVDALATIMNTAIGGNGGARMTGGGFGGCVVGLMPLDQAPAVSDAIARDYRAPDGSSAEVFICSATDGAGPV